MKVPDVGRNLVPGTWTADGEGALPVNWVRVLMTTAFCVYLMADWQAVLVSLLGVLLQLWLLSFFLLSTAR